MILYSGKIRINIRLSDDEKRYQVRLTRGGRSVWRGTIGVLPWSGESHKAPWKRYAHMDAARAALSFAIDEGADIENFIMWNRSGAPMLEPYESRSVQRHIGRFHNS